MGWAGSANIQGGVTIDLSSINQVYVSKNRLVTSVGPGARWGDVYSHLDAMDLAVAGGRVSEGKSIILSKKWPDSYLILQAVGVGGLLVGGWSNNSNSSDRRSELKYDFRW